MHGERFFSGYWYWRRSRVEAPRSRARTSEEQAIERKVRARAERAAREGVDWWLMRLVTSPHFSDGLIAIQGWTWADQVHAHKTLDALDDFADIARPAPPKDR